MENIHKQFIEELRRSIQVGRTQHMGYNNTVFENELQMEGLLLWFLTALFSILFT